MFISRFIILFTFVILPKYILCSLIPITDASSAENLTQAVDSDYLVLNKKQSTINHIGDGVFTKTLLKKDSIICEYRGPIINEKDISKFLDNDKIFTIHGPDRLTYHILGENICAYINDCTTIMKTIVRYDQISLIDDNIYKQCYTDYEYNATPVTHESTGKLFIVATRDIQPGEEIFYPYGL